MSIPVDEPAIVGEPTIAVEPVIGIAVVAAVVVGGGADAADIPLLAIAVVVASLAGPEVLAPPQPASAEIATRHRSKGRGFSSIGTPWR
jgi:hypothetical protein